MEAGRITDDESRRRTFILDLQYRLLTLFDAMLYSSEFPEGFRAALRLRGIHTGQGRQPQSIVQQAGLEQLSQQLQCLLAAEGFTNEPIGGCPAGNLDPSDVQQVESIVRQVVGELRKQGL